MNLSRNIKLIGFLVVMIWSGQVFSQNGENPFELKHRTEKKASSTGLSDVVEEPAVTDGNPFNVIRTPKKDPTQSSISKSKPPVVSKISKVVDDQNFRFWLTLIMLISLAMFATIYREQLGRAYRAFSNENVMRMLHRDKGTVSYIPFYLLYGMFIMNAGIFVYLLLRYYHLMDNFSNLTLLSYTIGGVSLLFFLKHTVLRLIGFIFPISKEASFYNMTITIFGIVLSVILFLSNVVIAYAPSNIISIFIYVTLGIIGCIYLFRAIRGLSIASKFLNHNKFHFFIYLCTVEIAPVLILWKMATSGIGVQ